MSTNIDDKPVLREQRCRTCLMEIGVHNIFDNHINDCVLYQSLSSLADIPISDDDSLPALICTPCFCTIQRALKFIIQCQTSHQILIQEVELDKQIMASQVSDMGGMSYIIIQHHPDSAQYNETDGHILHDSENTINATYHQVYAKNDSDSDEEILQPEIEIIEHDGSKSPYGQNSGEEPKVTNSQEVEYETINSVEPVGDDDSQGMELYFEEYVENKKRLVIDEGFEYGNIYLIDDDNNATPPAPKMKMKTVIRCKICNESFDRKLFATHFNKHLKCPECSLYVKDSSSLNKHLQAHSSKSVPENIYSCSVCHSHFDSEDSLVKHNATHTYNATEQCQICLQNFCSIDELAEHSKSHSENECFKCFTCGFTFARLANLRKHMDTCYKHKKQDEPNNIND